LESECVPECRTHALSTRWADMEDSDEEGDTGCQEQFLSKNVASELTCAGRLSSQQASNTCNYNTTPSITSAHCWHVQLSTDASADKAYAANKREEAGEVSEQKGQLLQMERGGCKKGLGKGHSKKDDKGSCKGGAKGSGKGTGKGACKTGKGRKSGGKGEKCQCQFIVGIEEEKSFRVCNKLLGPSGKNMKAIAMATGAKLRLRGRGSKFLEAPDWVESSDPLMLCLSAPDAANYAEAKRQVQVLMEDVYQQFRHFQVAKGWTPSDVFLDVHEGPRKGSF